MILQTWIFFMRKVVDKKKNPHFFRLEKSGSANSYFFFWFEKSGWPEKRWVYTINPHFFPVGEKWFCRLRFLFWLWKSSWPEKKIQVWRTTFVELLFYTFLKKWLQIKWLSELRNCGFGQLVVGKMTTRLTTSSFADFCFWFLKVKPKKELAIRVWFI